MRRTRVLVTLGPATSAPDPIRALIEAGADAFRLNFSHGTVDSHREWCRMIRDAAAASSRTIAIVQDLAGPKIRIGDVAAPLELAAGDRLSILYGNGVGGGDRVYCSVDALFTAVEPGARLLLDDGHIELEAVAASRDRIDTRVVTGGPLDSHKGISAPGVTLPISALTEKDRADLRAGIDMGVDMACVSFVQSADDLRTARELAAAAGAPDLGLIAKIEKPKAIENLAAILSVCDGLMVARGDLGVEMPLETLPAIQRTIIRSARQHGVPVIVATQVLESMRESPRPTRAEVTDAAHAVDQGADAIMLAGETAAGAYPREAVRTLGRIIEEVERVPAEIDIVEDAGSLSGATVHGRGLCEAAVTLARRAGVDAIVALTGGGRTARILSALRPAARILAVTPNAATAARLALTWGVTPVVIPHPANLSDIRQALVARGHLRSGNVAVFVAVSEALEREHTNFMHVEAL